MNEILDTDDLARLIVAGETNWKQYGEVNVLRKGDLLLFNYGDAAQWAGRWNAFERLSRGLIMDAVTGAVVARPFKKFWNYGQVVPESHTFIVEATSKEDGSLGICHFYAGRWRIATRGNFDSDQAQWAEARLNSGLYKTELLDTACTHLLEIIYPANRIVVDYGAREDLVLIGCINTRYGDDMYFQQLKVIADAVGFGLPKWYNTTNISGYLELASAMSANEEGFVVRYSDGQRYKIKGDAYKLAHKMLTGISFKRVLEATAAGTLDDWLRGVPDEFLTTIRGYQAEIALKVQLITDRVNDMVSLAPQGSRKEFAVWVQRYCPDIAAYMFLRFDERDLLPAIYANAFKNRLAVEVTDGFHL